MPTADLGAAGLAAGPPRLDEHDAWLHEIVMPVRVPRLRVRTGRDNAHQLVRSYPALRSRLWRRPDGHDRAARR